MKISALLFMMLLVSGCLDVKPETISNNTIFPESPVVDIAREDLAHRLNITTDEIKLVKLEVVNWRDSRLGYQEMDTTYAPVITPGFRIILEAMNKTYEYHSDYKRVVGPKEVRDVQ
ncbi:MAG: hypothetical protein O8C62_09190 [Candidatus Methanoperedens sp.]|nr:hypothetical protein [Candidatus Methanoperedens sp.]